MGPSGGNGAFCRLQRSGGVGKVPNSAVASASQKTTLTLSDVATPATAEPFRLVAAPVISHFGVEERSWRRGGLVRRRRMHNARRGIL